MRVYNFKKNAEIETNKFKNSKRKFKNYDSMVFGNYMLHILKCYYFILFVVVLVFCLDCSELFAVSRRVHIVRTQTHHLYIY